MEEHVLAECAKPDFFPQTCFILNIDVDLSTEKKISSFCCFQCHTVIVILTKRTQSTL